MADTGCQLIQLSAESDIVKSVNDNKTF